MARESMASDWQGKPIPEPEETTTHSIRRVPAEQSAIERSITCSTCGRTSYNPGDVVNRYCAGCKRFHPPLPPRVDPPNDWAWITDHAHWRDGAVYDVKLQSPTGATTGGSMTVARVWIRLDAYGMAVAAELAHRIYRSDPLWRFTMELNDGMTAWAKDWSTEGDFCALAVFTEPNKSGVKVARLPHVPDMIHFLLRQLTVWLPGQAAGRRVAQFILKNRGDYTAEEVALLEGEYRPEPGELVMKAGVGIELTAAELKEMNDAKDADGDVPFDRQADVDALVLGGLGAPAQDYMTLRAAQRRAEADPLPAALQSPENAEAYFQVDPPIYDSDEYVLPTLAAVGQLWGFRPFPPGTRCYVDERDEGDDVFPTIVIFGPLAKVYRTSGELVIDPDCEDARKCTTFQLLLPTDQAGLKRFTELRAAKEDEIYTRMWKADAHEENRTVTEVDFSKHRHFGRCDHRMPVAQYVLTNPLAETVARWKAGH